MPSGAAEAGGRVGRLAQDAEHAPVVVLVEAGEFVEAEEGVAGAGVAGDVVCVVEVAEARALAPPAPAAAGAGEPPVLCRRSSAPWWRRATRGRARSGRRAAASSVRLGRSEQGVVAGHVGVLQGGHQQRDRLAAAGGAAVEHLVVAAGAGTLPAAAVGCSGQ